MAHTTVRKDDVVKDQVNCAAARFTAAGITILAATESAVVVRFRVQ